MTIIANIDRIIKLIELIQMIFDDLNIVIKQDFRKNIINKNKFFIHFFIVKKFQKSCFMTIFF